MAAFSALTTEQQAVYLAYENDLRALAGETQRLFNKMVAIQARNVGQIAAILVLLDNNAIVPQSSGLSGAQSLDADADTAIIYADFAAMLTTYNTAAKQQLRAKACGQLNV